MIAKRPDARRHPPAPQRFHSTIEIRGINPYVLIDAERAGRLSARWRRPMPVRVQINDKPDTPWRVNLMPAGDGSFFLYLAGPVRKAAGVAVGQKVRVSIAFDPDYRGGPSHPLPAWFRNGLMAHPHAKHGWDGLAPSRQKEILRYFSALKSSQAQARNLERALEVLSGTPGRFMARTWNAMDTWRKSG
ncbi:MAG: DUF1905 domain-containing protein [Gammaproteobacteria bacterium]|nr:DUF1905 domain-containing protein [Gammaproteobacteria bacterium]